MNFNFFQLVVYFNNSKPVSYMSMSIVDKANPIATTPVLEKKENLVNGGSSTTIGRSVVINANTKVGTISNNTQSSSSIATISNNKIKSSGTILVSNNRISTPNSTNRPPTQLLNFNKHILATTTMTTYSGRVFMPRKTSEEYILSDVMEYDTEKATFVTRIEADADRLIQQRLKFGTLKNSVTDLLNDLMDVDRSKDDLDLPDDQEMVVDEDSINQAKEYLDTKLREKYGDAIRINPVRSSKTQSPLSITSSNVSVRPSTATISTSRSNNSILQKATNIKPIAQLTNHSRPTVTILKQGSLEDRATIVINGRTQRVVDNKRRTIVMRSISDEEKSQDSVVDGEDEGPPPMVLNEGRRTVLKKAAEEEDSGTPEEDQEDSDDSEYDGRGRKIKLIGKAEFKFNGKTYNSEADFDHAIKIIFEDCRQDYKIYQRSCASSTMLPGHKKCKLTFNSILQFRDHIFQVNELHFKCPNRPVCSYNKRCMTQIQYKKHLYRCTKTKMMAKVRGYRS